MLVFVLGSWLQISSGFPKAGIFLLKKALMAETKKGKMVNAVPMMYKMLSQLIFSEVEAVINGEAGSCVLPAELMLVAGGVLLSGTFPTVA